MTTETVLFYIFSGAIAMAYMIYGKKQRKAAALLCGLGLAVVPYFALQMWVMLLLSAVMVILPFMLKV